MANFLKNIIQKITHKKTNPLLLDSPKNRYSNLVNDSKITNIINIMPSNLTQLEKAYYIYLKLGEVVNEDPQFIFTDIQGKENRYYTTMDTNFNGICKSISELYITILKDKKINIYADLVKQYPTSVIAHVDTVIKINDKNYILNLISDLSRIKTSRRVNNFGFDLNLISERNPYLKDDNENYLKRLENYYGKIATLSKSDIERMDRKLHYNLFIYKFQKKGNHGIYTDDTIDLLSKEMKNKQLLKEYVLQNKDVPDEDLLKYKLDYIFENINGITDFNGDIQYLENIRYYFKILRRVLSQDETSRIQPYVASIGNDLKNVISILKVKPFESPNKSDDEKQNNLYYVYSNKEKKYISKTTEEMNKFMNCLDKDSLKIVGTFDRFDPRELDELEL